jgi:hydrogenase expression/formation protein HypE
VKESGLVRLEHGSGGALSRELVEKVIYPCLRSEAYGELADASPAAPGSEILVTTDGYVVDPPFFPGGDIGRLAVYGTCNDLAVSGAEPFSLALAMVIEEGFPLADVGRIVSSVAAAAEEASARVVTGDTKVVPRGRGGGIFLTSTGLGRRRFPLPLSPRRVRPGDRVVVSGPIGTHGLAILAARESLPVGAGLRSDAAFLYPLVSRLYGLGEELHFMRDATRGGVAAVLNEAAGGSPWGVSAEEAAFPVAEDTRAAAEILGLHPLEIANEGVFVAIVAAASLERCLELLRGHPLGKEARCVGEVTEEPAGTVLLETAVGGRRTLDFPRGLLLPRIC